MGDVVSDRRRSVTWAVAGDIGPFSTLRRMVIAAPFGWRVVGGIRRQLGLHARRAINKMERKNASAANAT